MNTTNIFLANKALSEGGIIAYPTEAVFGLGCDPYDREAVNKIYQLKKRDHNKGLILIAADWAQIKDLVGSIPEDNLQEIKSTWPGPVTWVFPTSKKTPPLVLGNEQGIAIRITDHPIAKTICESAGMPIVSTSANPEGTPPAKSLDDVKSYFPEGIDYYVDGALGSLDSPTQIRDALTGQIIRA